MSVSTSTDPHPRSILKRDPSPKTKQSTLTLPLPSPSCCNPLFSPHVHFPPTPGLISIHDVYSPTTYDRAPIIVSPNVCELPERHDRMYDHYPDSPPPNCAPQFDLEYEFEIESARREPPRRHVRSRSRERSDTFSSVKGSYFHPRAFEACEPEPELLRGRTHSRSSSSSSMASTASSVSLRTPVFAPDDYSPQDEELITPPDHYVPSDSEDEAPILPDVYVTPAAVYTRESTRREGNPWEADAEEGNRRPGLRRMATQPSLKRSRHLDPSFNPRLDEGCLAGF